MGWPLNAAVAPEAHNTRMGMRCGPHRCLLTTEPFLPLRCYRVPLLCGRCTRPWSVLIIACSLLHTSDLCMLIMCHCCVVGVQGH